MRFRLILLLAFYLTLLNWHCAEESPDAKRKEQVAEGYCECAAAIAALDARAKSVPDSSVFLTAMLDSMQQEYEKAITCLLPLRATNGLLKPADISEIQRILQKKCPNLANNKELITELLCR